MSDHLLIFIRNPEPGRVKTRLAATVGDARALEVYFLLLDITRNAALGVDCQRHLYYSDSVAWHDDWPSDLFTKHVQSGDGLGGRMLHAFSTSFATGAEKVVIIGSDCPEMTSDVIGKAFSALDKHDVVIGPAVDGGYYLLGMTAIQPDFFRNKLWSTDSVLAETLADVKKHSLRASVLPVLGDLDDEADLERSGL